MLYGHGKAGTVRALTDLVAIWRGHRVPESWQALVDGAEWIETGLERSGAGGLLGVCGHWVHDSRMGTEGLQGCCHLLDRVI